MGKIARRLNLEDIVSRHVPANATVGLGGLHFHNTPMAMVRELIRQEVAIGLLIPPIDGSINADQLIGAGLVREVQIAYLGMEQFGLAGRFRAAAERGSLRVRDCEEAGFVLGLAAGAAGLPFAALPPGFLPEPGRIPTIRSVNTVDYRSMPDPFSGQPTVVVRAIKPDVSLVHCQFVDPRGNCGFLGAPFLDLDLARAGSVCLVQAEQEVQEIPSRCRGFLPGYAVDGFCVLEGGAHPASSHGMYTYDDEHIRAYVAAAKSDAGFARYRCDVIGTAESGYRRAARLPHRLAELATRP